MEFIFILILSINNICIAQESKDTISLNFKQAEELFLKNNFVLLANYYNIDIAKAAVEQARLFNNPTIFSEINAYNSINNTWFYTRKFQDPSSGAQYYGTYSLQINQLILLAGKRSKLVNLAKANVALNKAAFDDVLRQLRNQLFITFTNLAFDAQSIELYQEEETRISTLVEIEKIALSKGAASGYELTRLQFELQDMQNQIKLLQNQYADDYSTFLLLLNPKDSTYYLTEELIPNLSTTINLSQVVDSALKNRPDLILANAQLEVSNLDLKLQKASKVPDLTIGATFDRAGGAYLNYTGLNIALPLPVFNRNQGVIKQAAIRVEQSKTLLNQTNYTVSQEANNAFLKLNNSLTEKYKVQEGYEISLQNISIQASENYNKRVIGLIDFLDKIHTYRNAKINLLNLQLDILQAQNNINYTTNALFFKF